MGKLKFDENFLIFGVSSAINKCLDKESNPENKKMYLITHLIDLDILTGETATESTWAANYSKYICDN